MFSKYNVATSFMLGLSCNVQLSAGLASNVLENPTINHPPDVSVASTGSRSIWINVLPDMALILDDAVTASVIGFGATEKEEALTLFDKQVSECQHDGVATVQVVPTHVVWARDGQTTPGNHLQHPAHLSLPVPEQLQREDKTDHNMWKRRRSLTVSKLRRSQYDRPQLWAQTHFLNT